MEYTRLQKRYFGPVTKLSRAVSFASRPIYSQREKKKLCSNVKKTGLASHKCDNHQVRSNLMTADSTPSITLNKMTALYLQN
jgi:hypothetical protein